MTERRKVPNFSGNYSEFHEAELRQEWAKISESRMARIRHLAAMGLSEAHLRRQFSVSQEILKKILEDV